MRRRGLPARAVRGAGLQRRRPRPEDLQRRRDPVEIHVRRGDAAAARRRQPTTMPASSKRRFRPAAARCGSRRSICPTATRRTPRNIHTKSNGWIGFLNTHMNDLNWKSRWSWPATTTSSRPPPTCTIPRPGSSDALFLPQTREKFRALTNLGLTDAMRAVSDDRGLYTFWDYQAGAWQKNRGIRIDHLLLSPQAADRLTAAGIDKHVRSWEKPSDHVPVYDRSGDRGRVKRRASGSRALRRAFDPALEQ